MPFAFVLSGPFLFASCAWHHVNVCIRLLQHFIILNINITGGIFLTDKIRVGFSLHVTLHIHLYPAFRSRFTHSLDLPYVYLGKSCMS